MSGTDKIAAGLAARKSDKTLKPAIGLPQLRERRASAVDANRQLRKVVEATRDALAKRLAEIQEAEDAAMISGQTDAGLPIRVGRDEAAVIRKQFDRQRDRARREATQAIDQHITDAKKRARQDLEIADGCGLGDSLAWATQHGAGSPELSRLIDQFSLMGPAAMEMRARHVLASRDKMQAAALALVVGALPSKKRPSFDIRQVTDAVFADDVDSSRQAIQGVREEAAAVEVMAREISDLSTVGSIGQARIEKGLIDANGSEWGDDDEAA